ncbi:MAG: SDR family oxidoreductase [Bacteroidetes bacterium]|nr:SDR family oxidoreductase [Bacteroidota bacterium]
MSNDKKKILLVGGSGYLGTHLRNILSLSYNLFFTSITKKENSIQLDILNKNTYCNIQNDNYDYIFILASTLQGLGTTALKEEYINLDTIGLSGFLQFASENKLCDKIIYTSSMTVYGINNIIPVKEEGTLEPLSTYGLSKSLGEKIINFYCTSNLVKGVILRIPGIYGGVRTSGYIYNTALKCKKNKPVKLNSTSLGYWETINVIDLCIWIKDFIEKYDWKAKVDIFNIGYGVKTDFIDCAYIIKDTLHSSSEITIAGNKGYIDFYLDNSKIKQFVPVENLYRKSLENYLTTIKI